MGNCVETFRSSLSTEKNHMINEEEEEEEEVVGGWEEEKEKSKNVRIKIVLRKEEVEWLMNELQKRKIEEVLEEIQTSRHKTSVAWKPSLDCILESPEFHHGMVR